MDLTDCFHKLEKMPKIGLMTIVNETDKRVYVTFTLNSLEISKRLLERFKESDITKDLLEDFKALKVKITILEVNPKILDPTDNKYNNEILRYLTAYKLKQYTDLGFKKYDFQYNPINYQPILSTLSNYDTAVCLINSRKKQLFVKSFYHRDLAIDFIKKTDIIKMLQIHHNKQITPVDGCVDGYIDSEGHPSPQELTGKQ